MVGESQYVAEVTRLHRTAAETRLRAIESQLALGFTLCAVAETEIRFSRPDEAKKVVDKLECHIRTIGVHIDEPNHVPSVAVSDLRKQLIRLKKRTHEIKSFLRAGVMGKYPFDE